ncbi:hypothetical protein Z043_119670 [Scleropages formosus]|uniref:Uncharacterized protein n=1 Tax=Scleropages formosus TaxID=113540 RepID=A0A0P7UKL9_SCLFO|nr:hypothetical protein Z043_119670 [Scleropages formosus]
MLPPSGIVEICGLVEGTSPCVPVVPQHIEMLCAFGYNCNTADTKHDINGEDIVRDLQKSTMGRYVINKEGAETGHHDDIDFYVERAVILENIGSVP